MIRNTKDLMRFLKFSIGGLTVVTAGLVSFFISNKLNKRKKYFRNFDPKTVEELHGKIVKVSSTPDDEDSVSGVKIFVEEDEAVVPVHLGPAWFVNRQFKPFTTGEDVSVRGSRIHFKGQDIIVAELLKRGKITYRLRDDSGSPFWYTKIEEQV